MEPTHFKGIFKKSFWLTLWSESNGFAHIMKQVDTLCENIKKLRIFSFFDFWWFFKIDPYFVHNKFLDDTDLLQPHVDLDEN